MVSIINSGKQSTTIQVSLLIQITLAHRYTHTHTHARTHARTHTHTHIHTHTHTHTRTLTHTHTHTRTRTHTQTPLFNNQQSNNSMQFRRATGDFNIFHSVRSQALSQQSVECTCRLARHDFTLQYLSDLSNTVCPAMGRNRIYPPGQHRLCPPPVDLVCRR